MAIRQGSLAVTVACACAALVAGGFMMGIAADQDKDPQAARFSIRTTDGSQLLCRIGLEKFPVDTAYSKLGLPMDSISRMVITPSNLSVVVELKNKDKITGKLGVETLDVISIIGRFVVPASNILEIASISDARSQALPDNPDAIRRCINNLRQIDGAKDQYALEYGGTNGSMFNWANIGLYIRDYKSFACPLTQGTNTTVENSYSIEPLGQNPKCKISGETHTLGR